MNLKTKLFKAKQSKNALHEGCLLVAEPLLSDDCFQRSVVFVVEHNDTIGSMGLVLNKLSDYRLNDLLEGIASWVEEIPLYIGGPLGGNRLFYLHKLGEIIPNSVALGGGLYINGDLEAMIAYLNSEKYDPKQIKFILGYCGWERGQLVQEFHEGVWAISPNTDPSGCITANGEPFWRKQVSQQLDDTYHCWLNYPKSAFMN